MEKRKQGANALDKAAGARLRFRRRYLKMTQSEVAEAIGVTFQQLQKYENGKNRMTPGRLQQLAEILAVHVSYFFDGLSPLPSLHPAAAVLLEDAQYIEEFAASADGLALAHAFTRIADATVRRRIVMMIEAVAYSGH